MHDGMPYGRNQGQGHSTEVDRQSPTGLIFSGRLAAADFVMTCIEVRLFGGQKTGSSCRSLTLLHFQIGSCF